MDNYTADEIQHRLYEICKFRNINRYKIFVRKMHIADRLYVINVDTKDGYDLADIYPPQKRIETIKLTTHKQR